MMMMMMNRASRPLKLPLSLSSSSLLQYHFYHLLILLLFYITICPIAVHGWSSVHSSSLWSAQSSPSALLPSSIHLCTQQRRRPFNNAVGSIGGAGISFALSLAAAADGNNRNTQPSLSSSPRPCRADINNDQEEDDDDNDDGRTKMEKSISSCNSNRLEFNIPNLLQTTTLPSRDGEEVMMVDHRHRSWLLEKIYRATQRSAAAVLVTRSNEERQVKDGSSNSSSSSSSTIKTTTMLKDDATIRPSIPLTNNPELEKVRLFLSVTTSIDDDSDHHQGHFGIAEDYCSYSKEDIDECSNSRYVASLPANVVFAMDRPLTYLREVLAYSSSSSSPSNLSGSSSDSSRRRRKEKKKRIREETVIFCPGPHTTPAEAMRQRRYLSQVMDGMAVVLLHVGTYASRRRQGEKKGKEEEDEDGDGVRVKLTGNAIRALKDSNLCTTNSKSDVESSGNDGGWYHVTYHGMDLLRAAVSWNPRCCDTHDSPLTRSATRSDWKIDMNVMSLDEDDEQQVEEDLDNDDNYTETDDGDQVIDTLIQLIDSAVRNEFHHRHPFSSSFTTTMDANDDEGDVDEEPHLVLLSYSATSRAIATAISRWLDFATSSSPPPTSTLTSSSYSTKATTVRGLPLSQARELLHRAVTVVTVAGVGVALNDGDNHSNDNDDGDGDGEGGEWRGFYPVGPAYLHVGMYDDPLFVGSSSPFSSNISSSKLSSKSASSWYPSGNQRGSATSTTTRGGGGVMVMDKTKEEERDDDDDDERGGGDVVVLRTFSPYYLDSNSSSSTSYDNNDDDGNANNDQHNLLYHPAHNPSASLIQFLSLILRKNGLEVRRSSSSNFRTLYEEGRKPTPRADITSYFGPPYYMHKVGELDLPSSEEELLEAIIYVTGGERWLLGKVGEVGEEEKGWWRRLTTMVVMMDSGIAEGTITDHFGYGVYDEIVEVCKDDDIGEERRGTLTCHIDSSSRGE